MPKKLPISFADLLTGVTKVHQEAAAKPGAQRWGPVREALKSATTHSEMAQKASDLGVFGKTEKGEPVRASLVEPVQWGSRMRAEPITGNVGSREAFHLVLHPESMRPDVGTGGGGFNRGSNPFPDFKAFAVYPEDPHTFENLYGPQTKAMDKRLGKEYYKPGSSGYPQVFKIDAERIQPNDLDPSMYGYRPVGADLYSLIYDMSRLPGGQFGITAEDLSSVNNARRLRNTLSHYFGHGDFGNVVPFAEEGVGRDAFSSQLFRYPISDVNAEKNYLLDLVPAKIYDQLIGVTPSKIPKMAPEQVAGLQLLREAQLAKSYGPSTEGVRPFDMRRLREIAEPEVSALADRGSYQLQRAFGPNTLGRSITTDEAIRRILKGEHPDDISYDMLKDVSPSGYKGRYAKGGLAVLG